MTQSYKLIDGILYQTVDTSGVQSKLNEVVEAVKPYKQGIEQCEAQIKEYTTQISIIVTNSGIDKEVAKVVDSEKASFLGI